VAFTPAKGPTIYTFLISGQRCLQFVEAVGIFRPGAGGSPPVAERDDGSNAIGPVDRLRRDVEVDQSVAERLGGDRPQFGRRLLAEQFDPVAGPVCARPGDIVAALLEGRSEFGQGVGHPVGVRPSATKAFVPSIVTT
jgi:hypothetical protein